MKYVKLKRVLEVIARIYPGAGNITITQGFKDKNGWIPFTNHEPLGYPIKELPRLYDGKYTAVQLRLLDRYGTLRHPDYQMYEFEEEFKWEPMDGLELNINQGKRDAVVLAVIGDEALIEYEMPRGSTALWVIQAGNPNPGCIRNVSYKNCPKKWLKAMEDAGTVWENNPQ